MVGKIFFIYLGWMRSTSGVEFGKRPGGIDPDGRSGAGSCVCVSDVFVLLSEWKGSSNSRFKRPITVRISGTIANKLPCIVFTVSVMCRAVFATWSDSPFYFHIFKINSC